MKKEYTILIVALIFGMMINLVGALDDMGSAKQNENMSIMQTCGDATYINISSIQFPDKTVESLNVEMTALGGGAYQYNFTNTSQLGRYDVTGISDGCEQTFAFYFTITPSGKMFSEGQSIAGFGIILGALVIAFFFMFFGFKISDNEKFMPLTLLFILISFTFIVYALHLSYAYTVDIFQYESLSSLSGTIYTTILWLLVSVGIISVILILMASIKAMGEAAKRRAYGEDFNPITNSYDI